MGTKSFLTLPPGHDVLQVERNVVLEQKDLIVSIQRRECILGKGEVGQGGGDRAQLSAISSTSLYLAAGQK